jgi:predicted Zn finger-like uncharacterized protein
MPIEVSCRSCAGRFRVPDNAAGKKIRCPKCKELIAVPSADPAILAGLTEKTVSFSSETTASAPAKKGAAEAWYLKTEEEETFGPVPRSELDAWYAEGRISPECQLLREGSEQWHWAGEIYPELDQPSADDTAANEATDQEHGKNEGSGASQATEDALSLNLRVANSSRSGDAQIKTALQPKRQTAKLKAPQPAESPADEEVSDRQKTTAALLALFLGSLGMHRIYLGYTLIGVVQLLLCGGLGIWQLIDLILILRGSLPDVHGRPLS